MFSKPLAFALLAAGCMTAAAGGAYVALRQDPPAADAVVFQPLPSSFSDASVPVATDGPATAPVAAPVETAQPPVTIDSRDVTPAPVKRKRETPQRARTSTTRAADRSVAAGADPVETLPIVAVVEPVPSMPADPEPAPQASRFEEVTVPAETVIGVQVDTAVTSERARIEDRVEGHVTRDVAVGGRVAIPAGTKLLGSVTVVERGGKFKERARIAVRFHTAQLSDGTRLALATTTVMREGDSPSRETAAKVGGSAVGGAILGAILGGTKGAVLGGTAGAAGGTAVVAAGGRNPATLPAGTTVSVRLMSDVAVTVER